MRSKGLTLVELLILLAILSILATIGVYNWQRTLRAQEQASFIPTLQGVFWQGTTEAASRGKNLLLVRSGNRLELKEGQTTLRVWEMPQGVTLEVPEGTLVTFTPPGKVRGPNNQELHQPLEIFFQTGDRRYKARVSLIGEVKVEAL